MRSVMILKRKVRPLYGQRLKNPYIVGPLFNDILHYKEPREVTDMIYDEVEDTDDQSLGKMKVILMDHIEELGVAGDVVEVDASYARFHLLSARKAVYYCDYNLNKYKDLIESGAEGRVGPSSAFVLTTVRQLAKECILVEMNDKHEWLIQKRHIRIAFRKTGYTVPEEAIQLPEIPITGPDIEGKEGKDFAVHIVINNQETVAVRCMVHHLGQELAINWMRAPRFVLLPEQQSQLLAQMPVLPMLEEDKQLEEEYIS
ncbi:39S ribosomal protein L9, mitochondrial-like isoform X2 [Oppia nitens]|nr:39S ribosomal protein L9, mitochondrial-like isoform X2 [Oppia nitens]